MERKYAAMYFYKRKVNGVLRTLTKQLNLTDSVEDAKSSCMKYFKENIKTNLNQFYIVVWDCESWNDNRQSIPVKIEELTIS